MAWNTSDNVSQSLCSPSSEFFDQVINYTIYAIEITCTSMSSCNYHFIKPISFAVASSLIDSHSPLAIPFYNIHLDLLFSSKMSQMFQSFDGYVYCSFLFFYQLATFSSRIESCSSQLLTFILWIVCQHFLWLYLELLDYIIQHSSRLWSLNYFIFPIADSHLYHRYHFSMIPSRIFP